MLVRITAQLRGDGMRENHGREQRWQTGVVLGSVVVPLTIRAAVDLFPSMDDTSPGFLIVNQEIDQWRAAP